MGLVAAVTLVSYNAILKPNTQKLSTVQLVEMV